MRSDAVIAREMPMKKPNFDFERREREKAKAAKKAEKAAAKASKGTADKASDEDSPPPPHAETHS